MNSPMYATKMANPHLPGKRSRFVTIDVSQFIMILLRGLNGALMRMPTFCSNVVNVVFLGSLSDLILSVQCFTTPFLVHGHGSSKDFLLVLC